jgi:histidinol dehydrogenase
MSLYSLPAGSIENHREREKGILVYPVYSRRSGGLSVGINFFPDRKSCSFDCPYCEVFPFSTNAVFSAEQMEAELRNALAEAAEGGLAVKDICFSGNGEPSLSPDLGESLRRAGRVRDELVPGAELVLITNGTGLLRTRVFELLRAAATSPLSLNIWLKLDAATPAWYQRMSRSAVSLKELIAKIKEFTASAPVIIQTMLCAVDGKAPPPEEEKAWERLLVELTSVSGSGNTGLLRGIQLYGKARPAPEDPKAEALPDTYLESRATSLRLALASAGASPPIPVRVYK